MGSRHFVQLSGWQDFFREAEEYLATATKAARKRPEVFTPEILYNLTAMAIEKYFMALLLSRRDLADNHTMADLVCSLARHVILPATLVQDLLFLDSFQEICDPGLARYRTPTIEDITKILATGTKVQAFVAPLLPPFSSSSYAKHT